MSRKLIPLLAACALVCLLPATALAKHKHRHKPKPHPYYLALGDSLAQGGQPFGPLQSSGLEQTIPTNQGYVNDLYAAERHKIKGLKLEDLGCLSNPGESTTTMLNGGKCHYAAGNQLAQAVKFIRRHKIAFITLDIGANNVDSCATSTGIDITCVENGVNAIQADVPTIAAKLRSAAGRRVRIVGMTYYDPFLAEWLTGPSGLTLAALSVTLAQNVNQNLVADYQAQHFKIADVATAFNTYVPLGTVPFPYVPEPVAVTDICQWTWECSSAPRGPNIHGNAAGYRVMAGVFKKTLG